MRKKSEAARRETPVLDISPEFCKVRVLSTDETNEAGELEGYASVFDNVDLGGDIVKRGAFAKTIKERLKKGAIKLVDSHRVFYDGTDAVIGVVTEAEEDERGLKFRARFSKTKLAQEIRTKIQEGILDALSFGYDVIKFEPDKDDKVRILKELKLYEISVVPWGMNPKAMIDTVKSAALPDEDKGVVPIGGFGLAPVERDWSNSEAKARIKSWIGDTDSSEWTAAQWRKFRSVHLWVGEDTEVEGSYKFLVCDVVDDSPKFVFKAASASLGVVRGGRGANEDADWWGSREGLETQIGKIYEKFGRELPEKEDTSATPEPNAEAVVLDDEAQKALAALTADVKEAAARAHLRQLLNDMRF